MHEYVSRFDRVAAELIRRLPNGLKPVMELATLIGQPIIVLSIAAIVAVTALFKGRPRIFVAECIGVVMFLVNTIIKYSVHRARPDTLYAHDMRIKSYSFPSGHAFAAMFFYGLLAYLAFKYLPNPWNLIVPALLAGLILMVGISRVFLGAHFPSDVVAGWLFGGVCLWLVIVFVKP